MSAAQWALLAAGTLAAAAFALWLYLRREVPVAGRPALAAMRTGTVALLVLLLLDPSLPGEAAGRGEGGTWVAVDLSLSMSAAPEGGAAPWETAARRAGELRSGGATVAGFGERIRFLAEEPTLLEGQPEASGSRLAPLLERAFEAGAAEVVVLSDFRLEDPVAVRAFLERGGLSVRFEDVGGEPVNAGVARWQVPRAADPGEAVASVLDVYGSEAAAGRTATVEVREDDRLVATRDVELPASGLVTTVPFELPPPAGAGTVRYEARIRLGEDAFEADDVRVGHTAVDPEEGLLVAVALTPDWELRFLLPVLERVTGLTARGYVRVAPDRYLPAGGEASGGPVDAAEVRRRVETAEMVVLQGLTGTDPEWLLEAAAGGRRAIVLPADVAGAAAAGVSVEQAVGGEWYVSPELPASAIAGELGGGSWQGLPPLTGILPPASGAGGDAPLDLRLQGSGDDQPAFVLLPGEGGRRAVMLASGFWRWGFRTGAPREAYRRLWAGVAGWLLADVTVAGGAIVRPTERVVARGQPVRWEAPTFAGREVRLQLTRGDSAVLDTVLAVPEGGRLDTPSLPPGVYGYRGADASGEGEEAEGQLEVEAHTDELRHAAARDLRDVEPLPRGETVDSRNLRPLRTHPLPYLLVLVLLCGEWIGRRHRGLR